MSARARTRVASAPAWATATAIGVVALALRLATAADLPTEWDSAQFSLGVEHFDTSVDQPHPPGYVLYILAARALVSLTALDAHSALLLLAAVASAATVAVGWLAGRELRGPWLGWAFAAFLLSEPLLWYYGSLAGTYAFDSLGLVILVVLAARAAPGSWFGVFAAFALGALAGFRQSALLFLWPLALVAVVRSGLRLRAVAAAAAAGVAGLLLWVVPLAMMQRGGLDAARDANAEMWENAARTTSPLLGASADMVRINRWQATGWTGALLVPLAPVAIVGAVAAIDRRARHRRARDEPTPTPPAAAARGVSWVVGALAVTVALQAGSIFLLHFGKSGYILGFLPAAALLMLLPAARSKGAWRVLASLCVAAASLFGAERFLRGEGVVPLALSERVPPFRARQYGAPFRATRSAIDEVDDRTAAVLAAVDQLERDDGETVYVFPAGPRAEMYRQLSYLRPSLRLHYVIGGRDWAWSRGHVQREVLDGVVEGDSRTRFVVMAWFPPASMAQLEAQGRAAEIELPGTPTGLKVWSVTPGSVFEGVRLG